MNSSWKLFLDPRLLGVLAVAVLGMLASPRADALAWGGAAAAAAFCVWLAWLAARRLAARRSAADAAPAPADTPEPVQAPAVAPAPAADLDAIRLRLREAVRLVRTSRLGEATGRAALYELPWCLTIGSPASGKSAAIARSGLAFPLAGKSVLDAPPDSGGTRDCDWFHSSEGIVIDTAGRYVLGGEADRAQWLGFLGLLRKARPRAPVNGIVVMASLAELVNAAPEEATRLAQSLRQRLHEVTERLEVVAPVYLVFTKADRVAGFDGFFEAAERVSREGAWGATLPVGTAGHGDAAARFDHHFAALVDGLRQLSIERLSRQRGRMPAPGVLSFPLEFAALAPVLRAFVAQLFEDNPYQHPPLWRGFYFTSALRGNAADGPAAERVARRFGLDPHPAEAAAAPSPSAGEGEGCFLKELYTRVVFADRALVRPHASPARRRTRGLAFGGGVAALALGLGGWTWSYLGNRQLAAEVRGDLDRAIAVQRERTDLASRIEALEILQDRIERLERDRGAPPWSLGLGLYQGDALAARLRAEYYAGLRQLMLEPVARAIEAFLGEVERNAARLQPMTRAPASAAPPLAAASAGTTAATPYAEASPASVEDAYNALKTYLMLGDRSRPEAAHLNDQLARFWRGWLEAQRGDVPREGLARSAERLIGFATAHLDDPAFPRIAGNAALVDRTRETLRHVVRGMPARERVYADVKARAATRFPQVTVARIVGEADRGVVVGSHAVPGTFTREAWQGYVEGAFREAATRELQSADWVLGTAARDDLTLEGSPEQVAGALAAMYKAEYVAEWKRFLQGVAVAEFDGFDAAVLRLDRLGDPLLSPLRKVVQAVHEQTSWDGASPLARDAGAAGHGALDWLRQTVLRQAPAAGAAALRASAPAAEPAAAGAVSREFAALGRLVAPRDDGPTRLAAYLEALSKVRARFHQVKAQGDPGPGALRLLAATHADAGSELAAALRQVDEQALADAGEGGRAMLRPLLVRPLVQAFGALLPPAETELNRVWTAQALDPFRRTLAPKYPFERGSRIEAAPAEVAQVFGPAGAIARFAGETLAPLVVRRGDTLAARTWAGAGVRLRPEFVAGFAAWVAPLEGPAARAPGDAAAAAQTVFQLLPQPAPGLAEYTVEIDGQKLHHRNAAASWERFAWPNPGGTPGVRISAVTEDGRGVDLLDEPGDYAFGRMLERARRRTLGEHLHELSWVSGTSVVTVHLRIVSRPGAVKATAGPAPGGLQGTRLPALVAGAEPPVPATAATGSVVATAMAAGARR